MFVYFLKHNIYPIFKVGKTKNIHTRMRQIGGVENFNVADSFCVSLANGRESYRLETILHRMFHVWNIQPEEYGGVRHKGDSEEYKIQCLDRLIKFLSENSDLTQASPLASIPPELHKVKTRKLFIDRRNINESDKLKKQEEKSRVWVIDAAKIKQDIYHLQEIGLDTFEICFDNSLRYPYPFIFVQTYDRSTYLKADTIFKKWLKANVDPAINYPERMSFIYRVNKYWENNIGTIKVYFAFQSKKRNRIYADDYFEIIKQIPFSSNCSLKWVSDFHD